MTQKTFKGDNFGLGVEATVPKPTDAPIESVRVTLQPPTKVTSSPTKTGTPKLNSQGYKRNSFGGSANMKLTSYNIDKLNAQKFKVLCAMRNTSASVVVNNFIAKYVKDIEQ
jgi:hypothetical protein